MPGGIAHALTVIRVARGAPRPGDGELRAVIERDRARLRLPPQNQRRDLAIAGPYAIIIDGQELDEYVAWEQ